MLNQKTHRSNLRPSFISIAALIFGIYIAACTDAPPWIELLVFFLIPFIALIMILLATRQVGEKPIAVLLLLLFASLGFWTSQSEVNITKGAEYDTTRIRIIGTIVWKLSTGKETAGPKELKYSVYLLKYGVDATNEKRLPKLGRVRITGYPYELGLGDKISFVSKLRKPRNRGNPGEFNWELYCLTNDILWQASARGPNSVVVMKKGNQWNPWTILDRFRNNIRAFLEFSSHGRIRAILKGIILGDRGEISPELRRSFADSGLVHLLSASGLHVGIVAMLASAFTIPFMRAFPNILLYLPKKKLFALIAVPLMILYCIIVGGRVPMVRALIMGLVVATAIITDRSFSGRLSGGRGEILTLPANAALIILLLNPWSLFTIGFQLSFLAVTAILIIAPKLAIMFEQGAIKKDPIFPMDSESWVSRFINTTFPGLRYLLIRLTSLFLITLAIQLVLTPTLLFIFHRAPMYSAPANVLATPALAIALPIALVGSMIGSFAPLLGSVILEPAKWLVEFIIYIGEFFSKLPNSVISVSSFSGFFYIVFTIISLAILWILGEAGKIRIKPILVVSSILLTLFCALGIFGTKNPRVEITYLNVGRADCALLRTPSNQSALIDTGPKYSFFDAGESIIIPFLRYMNVKSLEAIIISHVQTDHCGGLQSILKSIPVERVFINPVDSNDLAKIKGMGARNIFPGNINSRPFEIDGVKLSFLNYPAEYSKNLDSANISNNSSIVLKAEFRGASFLFTGDIELEAERSLIYLGDKLRTSALKVAHHGSASSSSEAFLEMAAPLVSIVPCSWPQSSGLPSMNVIKRLQRFSERVYWTGRDGAVTVWTDGAVFRASPYRGDSVEFDLQKIPKKFP